MQIRKHAVRSAIALFASAAFACVASGAPIPWSTPAGALDDYWYEQGGSDFGRFGDPTVSGNTFEFTPAAFAADETTGPIDDKITVIIDAGFVEPIDSITIVEWGTWEIEGGGDVSVQASLQASRIRNPPQFPWPTVTASAPTANFSANTDGSGTWTATTTLLLPDHVTIGDTTDTWFELLLTYRNVLQANSTTGTASIEKTGAKIIVPEPASLLALSLLALLVRRR